MFPLITTSNVFMGSPEKMILLVRCSCQNPTFYEFICWLKWDAPVLEDVNAALWEFLVHEWSRHVIGTES